MTKEINNPKISVVIPVYNADKFLKKALDSVLAQSFKDFEVIAVEDGSKDNSLEILKEYALKDSRVKVYTNDKNLGVSKTANRAIGLASGEYIARMDADDIMVQDRLKLQHEFLLNNSEYILVGGQVKLITESGNLIEYKNFPLEHDQISEMLFTAMPVQQATTMVNKSKLPKDFVWYDDGMNTAEEVELFFKLLNYGRFANLNTVVHDYRQHSNSLSHSNPKDTFRLTYTARLKGVQLHNYKPTLKAKIVSQLQRAVVNILPKKLIYPIYYTLRKFIVKK